MINHYALLSVEEVVIGLLLSIKSLSPYMRTAKTCGVEVVRCNIEKNKLGVQGADSVVFTEVLEHLHYYYHAPKVLAKISRALKNGSYLILATPNIASLQEAEATPRKAAYL